MSLPLSLSFLHRHHENSATANVAEVWGRGRERERRGRQKNSPNMALSLRSLLVAKQSARGFLFLSLPFLPSSLPPQHCKFPKLADCLIVPTNWWSLWLPPTHLRKEEREKPAPLIMVPVVNGLGHAHQIGVLDGSSSSSSSSPRTPVGGFRHREGDEDHSWDFLLFAGAGDDGGGGRDGQRLTPPPPPVREGRTGELRERTLVESRPKKCSKNCLM